MLAICPAGHNFCYAVIRTTVVDPNDKYIEFGSEPWIFVYFGSRSNVINFERKFKNYFILFYLLLFFLLKLLENNDTGRNFWSVWISELRILQLLHLICPLFTVPMWILFGSVSTTLVRTLQDSNSRACPCLTKAWRSTIVKQGKELNLKKPCTLNSTVPLTKSFFFHRWNVYVTMC